MTVTAWTKDLNSASVDYQGNQREKPQDHVDTALSCIFPGIEDARGSCPICSCSVEDTGLSSWIYSSFTDIP